PGTMRNVRVFTQIRSSPIADPETPNTCADGCRFTKGPTFKANSGALTRPAGERSDKGRWHLVRICFGVGPQLVGVPGLAGCAVEHRLESGLQRQRAAIGTDSHSAIVKVFAFLVDFIRFSL